MVGMGSVFDEAMDTLLQDLRYAVRMLGAKPGFTVTAVATLALGIGGSTAIFSLVNAVLLGVLPFRDSERLLMVWEDATEAGFPRNNVAPGNYAGLQAQNHVFEAMAAVTEIGFNLSSGGEPLKVEARGVTAGFFPLLGVAPQVGRVIQPEEDKPGANHVAVLSHGLWQGRFGRDPGLVGRDIILNGEKYAVIGVMPKSFQFMESYVGLWVPAALSAEDLANHGAHYLTVIARTKPGVTAREADADVATIATRISRDFPAGARGLRAYVLPLREQLVGDARRPLLLLSLAIVAVLLIACANIAGLLLARAASRVREIAVRTALGAQRGRIVRQLLTESVLLSALGVVPGLLVAVWTLSFLEQLVPAGLTLWLHPTLDARAVVCALALSLSTGLLFGLAPALQTSRIDVNEPLRRGGRTSTDTGPRRLRSALVVTEIAATLVLLVGAGLLAQTLYRMRYVDLGLQPERLLTLRTVLPSQKYGELPRRAAFYEQVLERVAHLPGVVAAGYSTSVPLEWKGGTSGFFPEGIARPEPGLSYDANHRQVSADFLRTMGVPLRRGRFFDRTDRGESRPVAIVNETMARQYWPEQDAVGKRFKIGDPDSKVPWVTIVGIVGDVRQMGLDAPVKAEMYLPYSQITNQPWFAPRDLVVRTNLEPMSVVAAIKHEIAAVDPEQAVSNIRSLDDILDEEVVQRRLGATLLAAFAVLALLLASLGIYGILSYFVAQHTPEIGVRVALGATGGDILRLVLGRGMTLVLIGVGLGWLGGLALTRLMSSLLFGISATDPATFAFAALLLTALALLACYLPARRAVKVDPTIAMRYE
jgi:putative ABC transport system permease protein